MSQSGVVHSSMECFPLSYAVGTTIHNVSLSGKVDRFSRAAAAQVMGRDDMCRCDQSGECEEFFLPAGNCRTGGNQILNSLGKQAYTMVGDARTCAAWLGIGRPSAWWRCRKVPTGHPHPAPIGSSDKGTNRTIRRRTGYFPVASRYAMRGQ